MIMARKRRKKTTAPAVVAAVSKARVNDKSLSKKRKLPPRIDLAVSTNRENNHSSAQVSGTAVGDKDFSKDHGDVLPTSNVSSRTTTDSGGTKESNPKQNEKDGDSDEVKNVMNLEQEGSVDLNLNEKDDDSQHILFLEEQVKIHEATLLAWRQRREAILVERETVLAKKRELIELRSNLIERQANLESAQTKQLVLQAELQESLTTSREKLKRLLMLETEEAEETNSDMSCSSSEEEMSRNAKDAKKSDSNERNEMAQNLVESVTDGIPNEYQYFEVVDSYQTVKELSRYYHSAEDRKHSSLLPFLPYLDSDQVGSYLTIMQREMCALDREHGDKGRSFRRQLLQNTCLDILLLAVPRKSEEQNSVPNAYSDEELQYFDPSISLCPYELGGICADEVCPYQHTTKETKILARERLPLPPLSQSFLSIDEKAVEGKSDDERKKTKGAANEENKHHKAVRSPAQEIPLNNDDDDDDDDASGEEDFISLPTSTALNGDDKGDNLNHFDADDENVGEGKDHVLISSLSKVDNNDEKHNKEESKCVDPIPYWWSESFGVNDETPHHENGKSSSIFDALEDKFGLFIQAYPKSALAATEDSPTSTEKRLKIKEFLPKDQKRSNQNSFSQNLNALGRLLDSSRLAIHGGLHDIVLSLDTKELMRTDLPYNESIHTFSTLLLDQTRKSRFFDQCAPSLSCFEEAFATQIGLAILSWSLAAYSKASEQNLRKKSLVGKKIALACERCLDDLRNPIVSTTYKPPTRNIQELENFLRDSFFNKSQRVDDDAVQKIKEMQSLISWTRVDWFLHGEEVEVLDESFEERLICIWSAAKEYLSEVNEECKHDESGEDSIPLRDTFEQEYRYLKVVIIVGLSISGCLSEFARVTILTKRTDVDGLSASNMAVWSLLDVTISRLLKDLGHHLRRFPFADLVLAPLYAHSIASASYLRKYSIAQTRLVEYLSTNQRLVKTMNFVVYSELLWSQLIQLRMSLPNEAPIHDDPSFLGRNLLGKTNLLAPRDTATDFPCEPSQKLKEENLQLINKLKFLDIRLRHVVLWGDRLLSSLAEKYQGDQVLLRLFSKKRNESKIGSIPIGIQWKDDLETFLGESLDHKDASIANLAGESSRCYPPPAPLPRLPLFLLYAGKYLTDLDLKGCHLENLPFGFGLYFPNLRKLDLSSNGLKELPDSFRRLTHRMKFLEEFYAANNKLENLPPDIFSAASKQSISPSQSSLQVLVLSHNNLVSIPSLLGLDRLEILDLENNSLVDMFAADWSRLALRLPALRILNRNHQNAREVLP